jgi:predicted acyl esterase
MGPRDQRAVETHDDVLVYSTPVLDQPVEVIGPIGLRLFVASSARDTVFVPQT